MIYCTYVSNKNDGGGSTTVARQLRSALDDKGITESWMENYYDDLSKSIEAAKGAGREIIIGGDFNEETKERGLMKKTLSKLGLVNVFEEKMNEVPPTRRGEENDRPRMGHTRSLWYYRKGWNSSTGQNLLFRSRGNVY